MLCHAGPRREAPGLARRQREGGEMQARAFITDSLGRDGKAGLTKPGLAYLNNVSRL